MVTVTEQAQHHILSMIKETFETSSTTIYVKFCTHGGGCSGLSYGLSFEQAPSEQDYIVPFETFTLFVPKEDLPIVKGTVIDYKQNMLTGGFTITNPNAMITCGCGSSFRTKENKGKPTDC